MRTKALRKIMNFTSIDDGKDEIGEPKDKLVGYLDPHYLDDERCEEQTTNILVKLKVFVCEHRTIDGLSCL